MSIIIYQGTKNPMQAGMGKTDVWFLEIDSSSTPRSDSLMGWSGGRSTLSQLRLRFDSQEAAIAYAQKHYGNYTLLALPPRAPAPVKSYSANFAYQRRGSAWTH